MGSKKFSQEGIMMVDVAMNMTAFEVMNDVKVELRLSTVARHGRSDIQLTGVAHSRAGEIGELPPLASVSVTCLATNLTSTDAALIHVLYLLDGQLAEREMLGLGE